MKKSKKGIAVLCSMVLAVALLFSCAVMKIKAEGTATANLTIHFVESIENNAESSITKAVAITIGADGTGTIDLASENITYDKGDGDTRYVISWYDASKVSISSSSNYNIGQVTAGETKEIELYAVYGAAIQINFDNNASYMGKGDSVIVTKYYQQKDASLTEFSLPAAPSELSSEFVLDGYTFKGWGESDSGNVEISEIPLSYGNNRTLYAHWQDQRPQGTITDAGEYYLETGNEYTLGDGTWTVSGDTTKYAGGITFYVTTTGTYTFSKE